MSILALSVRQPYASAFFRRTAAKDVENRPRPTSLRGRVAIHAGKLLHAEGVKRLGTEGGDRGVVLGTVEIVDCHRQDSPACREWGCRSNGWAEFAGDFGDPRTRFHTILQRPREFVTPIPARGMLGYFDPGPSVSHLIRIAEVVTR